MILNNLKHWFLKFLQKFNHFTSQFLIWFLIQIRPLFGPSNVCPFYIGCTQFAILQLEQHCIPKAIWNILLRLMKCNPFWFRQNRSKQ